MKPHFRDYAEHVQSIVAAALAAVEPAGCVAAALRAHPGRSERPAVIAVGKAAAAMYRGYTEAVGEPGARFVLIVEGTGAPVWARLGDHPLPTPRNVEHARALEAFLRDPAHQGFVVLLSGGASALLSLPAAGLSVDALAAATDSLLRAGADIHELNTVRKHLEVLKGGRAARLTNPRTVDLYAMSDVFDNHLSVIGSGPWWPDGSTYDDALEIIARRRVRVPPSVVAHLREGAAGHLRDTPTTEDPCFRSVRAVIVGHNGLAVAAAEARAAEFGFAVGESLTLSGDAGLAGGNFAKQAFGKGPRCVVGGGETTVDVQGASGRGGRNQELALGAALALDGKPKVVVATFATDGVDGPTDAAGAIVTGQTCARALELGIDPHASLEKHDSYGFFERVGGHLKPGPTGTNVNDLALGLVYDR